MSSEYTQFGPLGSKEYGFFHATVLRNDDPEQAGRVKLFSPHIGSQLHTFFKLGDGKYSFNFPGDTINNDNVEEISTITSALTSKLSTAPVLSGFSQKMLDAMAGVLDWVPQAAPLVGSGTIGQFSAPDNMSYISDARPAGSSSVTNSPRANAIDVTSDGPQVTSPVNPKKLYNKPPGYINSAKGLFSVPRVGAKVWVFFEGGEITHPVYFAYSYSHDEYKTIFNHIHVPTAGENSKTGDKMYTGKLALVERGGLIEITNTESFEKVRIADYYGNHITMSKDGIKLESQSDMHFDVKGDVYKTIKGNYILEVTGEMHQNVQNYGHEVHGGDIQTVVASQKKYLESYSKLAAVNAQFANIPKHTTTVVKDFSKKTPNNKICFPKNLKFSLPAGLDPKILLDKINKVLLQISGAISLPLLLLKGAENMVADVAKLVSNPFNFLLSMLGDRIKLLGIKLCKDDKLTPKK